MGSKTSEKKKWARCNCVRKWKYSPSRYCLQASRVQTRVNQTRTQNQSCCTASLFLTEPSNRQANAFTTDFSKRPRRHLTFSSGRDKLWRSRRTSQSRGSLFGCATRTDRRFIRFVRRMNYDCGGQGRHDRSGTMGIRFLLRALQAEQSVERLDVSHSTTFRCMKYIFKAKVAFIILKW